MHFPPLRMQLLLALVLAAALLSLPASGERLADIGPKAGETTLDVCVRRDSDDSLVAGAHVRLVEYPYNVIDADTDGSSCPGGMVGGAGAATAYVDALPAGLVVARNSGPAGLNPYVSNSVDNPALLAQIAISYSANTDERVTFWVAPLLTTIQGHVWRDDNHNNGRDGDEGLSGYDVQAFHDGVLYRRTTTSADGSYGLAILQPGTYLVKARQTGNAVWVSESTVVVAATPPASIVRDLEVPGAPANVRLYGTVFKADNSAADDVVVHLLTKPSWSWIEIGQVNPTNGAFQFMIVPSDRPYRLQITYPPSLQPASATLPPGVSGVVLDATTLHFDLPAASAVGPFAFRLGLAPGATATLTPAPSWWDPIVGAKLSVRGGTVAQGQIIETTILMDTYEQHEIYELSIDLRYDPTLLQVVDATGLPASSVTVLPDFAPSGLTKSSVVHAGTGSIEIEAEWPIGSGYGGSGQRLATITFRALTAPAIAALHFQRAQVAFTGTIWFYAQSTSEDGSVTITAPTPAPNAALIHGLARDPQGQPIRGATVRLLRDVGTWQEKAAGLTGADGTFRLWCSAVPGNYRVEIYPPAGYRAVSASLPQGVAGLVVDVNTLQFTLPPGLLEVGPLSFVLEEVQPVPTIPAVGTLQGYIWYDQNGDDQRQDDEGFGGCQVQVLDTSPLEALAAQQVVAETVTENTGLYRLLGLGPGDYLVSMHDPLGRLPDSQRPVSLSAEADKPTELIWRIWRSFLAHLLRQ